MHQWNICGLLVEWESFHVGRWTIGIRHARKERNQRGRDSYVALVVPRCELRVSRLHGWQE